VRKLGLKVHVTVETVPTFVLVFVESVVTEFEQETTKRVIKKETIEIFLIGLL
jgi:hypothetical protein